MATLGKREGKLVDTPFETAAAAEVKPNSTIELTLSRLQPTNHLADWLAVLGCFGRLVKRRVDWISHKLRPGSIQTFLFF